MMIDNTGLDDATWGQLVDLEWEAVNGKISLSRYALMCAIYGGRNLRDLNLELLDQLLVEVIEQIDQEVEEHTENTVGGEAISWYDFPVEGDCHVNWMLISLWLEDQGL